MRHHRIQEWFLNVVFSKSSRLVEFNHLQATSISRFATHLRETWSVAIKAHIKHCLKDVGKGWFNLNETSDEVYKFSKLRRFLMMINFMMEDHLRNVVTKCLKAYAEGIADAVAADVTIHSVRCFATPCWPVQR